MGSLSGLLIGKRRAGTQARKLPLSFCRRWGNFRAMTRTLVLLLFLSLAQARASAQKILFAEDFSHGLSNGWENVSFFKTPTDYHTRGEGTNFYVEAVADHGCSALSVKLDLPPPAKLILRWRWRIGGVPTNGSERELSRFDHAGRVFVAFDTFIGPPRTLNYLWGNVEPVGSILEHPKSGRAQLVIVESGNAKAGRWVREERDVTADWARAFPGRAMPKIVGLGVMTDGDSLGVKLRGDYADLELLAE
jgi:hypothetical protein